MPDERSDPRSTPPYAGILRFFCRERCRPDSARRLYSRADRTEWRWKNDVFQSLDEIVGSDARNYPFSGARYHVVGAGCGCTARPRALVPDIFDLPEAD